MLAKSLLRWRTFAQMVALSGRRSDSSFRRYGLINWAMERRHRSHTLRRSQHQAGAPVRACLMKTPQGGTRAWGEAGKEQTFFARKPNSPPHPLLGAFSPRG